MDGCLFCAIVEDHARSEIMWDDELVLAFLDINPVTDGHLLIIPKRHAVGLDDVPALTAARMMTVAHRLARALKESSLRCDGVNLFFADGEAAFKEIFHSHLHVFPRSPGTASSSTPVGRGRHPSNYALRQPLCGQSCDAEEPPG